MSSRMTFIHLSDLHFGPRHRFTLPLPASGGPSDNAGVPTLAQSIKRDLERQEFEGRASLCLTGDLTHGAEAPEFEQATQFIDQMVEHPAIGSRERVFVVPGNHDVTYTESDKERRWGPYTNWYARNFRNRPRPEAFDLKTVSKVHHYTSATNVVVLELNSCTNVQQGSPAENRGEIVIADLEHVRQQLMDISNAQLGDAIKVAMIHHHPVLIPNFAESGRGYDAVVNAGHLLTLLRSHGFHLVLHGHKHLPCTFSFDVDCAWINAETPETWVVAGGSAGSTGLPDGMAATNTYNIVDCYWNRATREGRIRVKTRGLVRFNGDGQPLLPSDWHWTTLKETDRDISHRTSRTAYRGQARTAQLVNERDRIATYTALRGNMPVVRVRPSLVAGQEYEAHFYLRAHDHQREVPREVTWSAGPMFDELVIPASGGDHTFSGRFHFYGGMLLQATLVFADGTESVGHVYATF